MPNPRSGREKRRTEFIRVGGHPAPDLANTLPAGPDGARVDLLGSDADVLRWLEEVGLLGARDARAAAGGGGARRRRGGLLGAARALRAVVAAALERLAEGRAPAARDVAALGRHLARGAFRREVAADGAGGIIVRERPASLRPEDLLAPVAAAAAALLADPARPPLRRCAGRGCVLFFLDTSRRGARRWCSMATCGNRAKAAAYYRTHRRTRRGRRVGV
jgi:predicted RNA-binding Zn ribbon-like protein